MVLRILINSTIGLLILTLKNDFEDAEGDGKTRMCRKYK
jgi:hypothetical protein